jgi:hypothetical protein
LKESEAEYLNGDESNLKLEDESNLKLEPEADLNYQCIKLTHLETVIHSTN